MENQDCKTGNLHEGEGDAMDVGEGGHCSPHVSKLGCVLINLGVCFDVMKWAQLNHHCSCHESKFSETIGKVEKQSLARVDFPSSVPSGFLSAGSSRLHESTK